jgi:hypothetical protein
MEWYNNYYMNYINCNLNDFKLKLKNNENLILKEIDNKENVYLNKINELEHKDNNDIIDEYKTLSSLHILEKENDLIELLTKYTLENNIRNYNLIVKGLELLFSLSEILRLRLKQDEIKHDNKFNKIITRSSYKFCNYKENCKFNYDNNNKNKCFQDHYVHNMVSSDILILIKYINENNNDKEIIKTLNTLNFVINHMVSELKNKCMYSLDKCEDYHIINNIKKKI